MGSSWNYFKSYKIETDEDGGDNIIHYLGGDSLGLSDSTAGQLVTLLSHLGILFNIYDWLEPPESKILELTEPALVSTACQKGIELLKESTNPKIQRNYLDEQELLFKDSDLESHSVESLNDKMQHYLEKIRTLSDEGYYFTKDNE